ncbi:MAG: SAVED domain-containing protein [Gemmatimonadetes bacterium]|nr:SAVED domain-containing protein [Gemmatimonadota bacterium]MYB71389.1 SAVED domain-containing protein [Gemmatimonadota bacterium]
MVRLEKLLRRIGRHPSQADLGKLDPRGPVFVSYRVSDGFNLATNTAWALRAAGVPVWHDESDLPPGDTERRLAEALESGLSGAVLLVTPEIEHSRIVREIELPQLLQLAENPAFTLSVLSVIEREPEKLDYGAPDRLLAQPEGTLKNFKQEPARTLRQQADAARAQCQRRMQAIRSDVETADRVVTLDVQTRIPPFATRVDADLVLRLRPPIDGDRRPHHQGLHDLKMFLSNLPQLVALAGAEHATVRGGAHLSVAYAIGAALPTTLIGRIEIVDTAGDIWSLTGNAPAPNRTNELLEVKTSRVFASTGAVLVYLDLPPTLSNSAFDDILDEDGDRFASAVHVRPLRDGNLKPEEAAAITGEASRVIRDLADQFHTSEVHLLLRCPWTVALLLGRTLNTIRVHLYEWENGPDDCGNPARPRYLPSLVVSSGTGGGPIETVLLPVR